MKKQLGLIIEPQDLAAVMGDPELLIVDICSPQNWVRNHVHGAVHVSPAELVSGVPPATGKLPGVERLQAMLGRIGYTPQKHIVVYDDEGGGWAGRFIWTLDVIGHKHYSYLNGGLHAWYKEQHAVDAEVIEVEPTHVEITLDSSVIAELDTVKAALGNANIKIWDARSAEEYAGAKSSSARAGHIPGAVNLDWLDTMDHARNFRLLPLEILQQKLSKLGINPGNEIITHCQTHHRSGLTYLAAKALGYKVRAYHGSWGEWGNLYDTPIEMLA